MKANRIIIKYREKSSAEMQQDSSQIMHNKTYANIGGITNGTD